MRAGYALSGYDGAIAEARHHAGAFLEKARTDHHLPVPPRARDLTQLVVSELVTNALKYAPGPILLELCINARAVDIVVWDSDPTVPAAQAADPDRIGQHGLEIVQAVTEDLFTEQAGGRQAHHGPHRPVRRPRWACHQSPPLVADSALPLGSSPCRDVLPPTAHGSQGAGSHDCHDIPWGPAGARFNETATRHACADRSPVSPLGLPRPEWTPSGALGPALEADYLPVGHTENLCWLE
ncbi:ATP-binding protein [Streptomyces sp. NPDC048253]|uniref:ATP-binding protein n=1 Tax=Streptomyces sp. NPDC048253 TaxID=3365524 RepID=UPI003714ABEF